MMNRLPSFGSALSAIALASVVAGCAGPMSRQSAAAAKLAKSDIGLATRAHAALTAGDFATAVHLFERSVEKDPRDALLRGLLGNAYFGAGRFASAETAYQDALALAPNQPKVVLKLALVQIAQGSKGEALAFLNAARNVLDPADYGLALALAGEPGEAVIVLETAARAPGADARLRQNLAFAYGLAGDWLSARTIASQDLPADQVSPRVQQWMALATPVRASDQVAALVGVTPAAVDPGQPVGLALRDSGSNLAETVQPEPVAPQPVQANAITASAAQPVELPPVMPEYEAPAMSAAFEAPPAEEVVSAPAVAAAAEPAPPPLVAALGPQMNPEAPKADPKPRAGNSGVVVQLGAYSSPERVETAWEQIAGRHSDLREYTPTSARFDGPK
jgi:D-alanyl-D-alanine carboxypeptidase